MAQHYQFIARFWGTTPTAEAYTGLGDLYVQDERYTVKDGKPDPAFAEFLRKAIAHFAAGTLS